MTTTLLSNQKPKMEAFSVVRPTPPINSYCVIHLRLLSIPVTNYQVLNNFNTGPFHFCVTDVLILLLLLLKLLLNNTCAYHWCSRSTLGRESPQATKTTKATREDGQRTERSLDLDANPRQDSGVGADDRILPRPSEDDRPNDEVREEPHGCRSHRELK